MALQPNDPLYQKAKQILQADPKMGKKRLAQSLGVRTPTSRLLGERFRGETLGHNAADPVYQSVCQVKNAHPDWGAKRVAQTLGLTRDKAKLHLARWIGAQVHGQAPSPGSGAPPALPPPSVSSPRPSQAQVPPLHEDLSTSNNQIEDSIRGDSRCLSFRGDCIRSLDQLLNVVEVDPHIWTVERHTIRYGVGARVQDTDEIISQRPIQIGACLKRRTVELKLEQLGKSLVEQIKSAAPVQPAIFHPSLGPKPGMLEISIMDLHLGKRSWAPETGREYSPEIARKMFWAALKDLLARASTYPVERILFVCGNDYLNTDNGRTTTHGTPQDESLVWQESFVMGVQLLVDAIECLRKVALVKVVIVQGNHDGQRIFMIGEVLAARFHATADVEVDNSPAPRKYVRYGNSLIGFTHGAYEKHLNLPILMATDRRTEWGETRHHEFHLGHLHSKQTKIFAPLADKQAVIIRILPSLCSADSWHTSMGFTGKLAAEALYWDREDGCVATFTHSPA